MFNVMLAKRAYKREFFSKRFNDLERSRRVQHYENVASAVLPNFPLRLLLLQNLKGERRSPSGIGCTNTSTLYPLSGFIIKESLCPFSLYSVRKQMGTVTRYLSDISHRSVGVGENVTRSSQARPRQARTRGER